MKKIVDYFIVIFLISFSISFGQIDNSAKNLINQLSLWNPVTLEQIALDIESQNIRNQNLNLQSLQPFSIDNQFSLILQVGDYNDASIYQEGFNNYGGIIQIGDNNEYSLSQIGNNLYNLVLQVGNYNTINQDISGNNINMMITQRGSFHELTQVEHGNGPKDYVITQSGIGSKLIIVNGSLYK